MSEGLGCVIVFALQKILLESYKTLCAELPRNEETFGLPVYVARTLESSVDDRFQYNGHLPQYLQVVVAELDWDFSLGHAGVDEDKGDVNEGLVAAFGVA